MIRESNSWWRNRIVQLSRTHPLEKKEASSPLNRQYLCSSALGYLNNLSLSNIDHSYLAQGVASLSQRWPANFLYTTVLKEKVKWSKQGDRCDDLFLNYVLRRGVNVSQVSFRARSSLQRSRQPPSGVTFSTEEGSPLWPLSPCLYFI